MTTTIVIQSSCNHCHNNKDWPGCSLCWFATVCLSLEGRGKMDHPPLTETNLIIGIKIRTMRSGGLDENLSFSSPPSWSWPSTKDQDMCTVQHKWLHHGYIHIAYRHKHHKCIGVGHTVWAPKRYERRSQAGPKVHQLEVRPQLDFYFIIGSHKTGGKGATINKQTNKQTNNTMITNQRLQ